MEDSLMLRTNFLRQGGRCIMGEAQDINPTLLALSNATSPKSLNNILEGGAMKVLNLLKSLELSSHWTTVSTIDDMLM